MPIKPTDTVVKLAQTVQARLTELYDRVGEPEPGSALDQCGLRDGLSIVEDYVLQGETRLAVEHLLYMVVEPALRLSREEHAALEAACRSYGVSPSGLLPPAADDA